MRMHDAGDARGEEWYARRIWPHVCLALRCCTASRHSMPVSWSCMPQLSRGKGVLCT